MTPPPYIANGKLPYKVLFHANGTTSWLYQLGTSGCYFVHGALFDGASSNQATLQAAIRAFGGEVCRGMAYRCKCDGCEAMRDTQPTK